MKNVERSSNTTKEHRIIKMTSASSPEITLPRVAITFCTQCKWMLRAAYFAQELLSTFGTTIGEVALIPASGGIFTVSLTYVPRSKEQEGSHHGDEVQAQTVLLWDRKAEGGFPGVSAILFVRICTLQPHGWKVALITSSSSQSYSLTQY